MMAGASAERRSAPVRTADSAVQLVLDGSGPVRIQGRNVDASDLPRDEDLRLGLRVTVDWERLRRDAECPGPTDVLFVARCGDTRWSHVVVLAEGVDEDVARERYREALTIPRNKISGRVDCEVAVAVSGTVEKSDSPESALPGTVVAREEFRIRLERGGFRFPTRWVSFEDRNLPARSLWYLDITEGSWMQPVEASVSILLNKGASDFFHVLEDRRKDYRVPATALRAQVAYDVLAQMITAYLTSEASNLEVDPDGRRLCDVVDRTIDDLFGPQREDLDDVVREDPSRFRLELQDAMNLKRSVDL